MITDILSLGTEYTVTDQKGNVLKSIQIIPYAEIIEASLGFYNESFESFSDYLNQSIAEFSGHDDIDPHRVLWYSTYDDEVLVSEIIQYAVTHGYDRIILEQLDEEEEFE